MRIRVCHAVQPSFHASSGRCDFPGGICEHADALRSRRVRFRKLLDDTGDFLAATGGHHSRESSSGGRNRQCDLTSALTRFTRWTRPFTARRSHIESRSTDERRGLRPSPTVSFATGSQQHQGSVLHEGEVVFHRRNGSHRDAHQRSRCSQHRVRHLIDVVAFATGSSCRSRHWHSCILTTVQEANWGVYATQPLMPLDNGCMMTTILLAPPCRRAHRRAACRGASPPGTAAAGRSRRCPC